MSAALWVPLPLAITGLGAVLVYGVARLATRRNGVLASVTATVLVASLVATLRVQGLFVSGEALVWPPQGVQHALLQADPGAMLMTVLALSLGALVALYSGRYLALDRRYESYYPLLLLLVTGVIGMVASVDLFALYLFAVLTNTAAYVLVAFRRRTETAIEAGFKYAIMGSMGSIMVLAGIGFVLRSSGTLLLPLKAGIASGWHALGAALVLFGFLVKAAIFPAHTWLPDAHGRAPSSISAMLSGIVVEAHLYVVLKVGLALGLPGALLGWLLLGLATLSMTVGNLMALRQTYGKRLLGYSSIAQVGYMMAAFGLGLIYARPELIAAGLFLLAAHAVTKGLAFLAKGTLHFYCDASLVSDLNGIHRRAPVTAACFALALAGLGGLPPLVGFVAKLRLLVSAVGIGQIGAALGVAALAANSLLSLGYYLPLIGRLFARGGAAGERCAVSAWMQWPVVALASAAVGLGIAPGPLLEWADSAARFLLAWGPG